MIAAPEVLHKRVPESSRKEEESGSVTSRSEKQTEPPAPSPAPLMVTCVRSAGAEEELRRVASSDTMRRVVLEQSHDSAVEMTYADSDGELVPDDGLESGGRCSDEAL
jgi:hypothetical protein